MVLREDLEDFISQNNNLLTSAQALELGVSRPMLSLYVKEGLLRRLHAGIYCLPDKPGDQLAAMALTSSYLVFSHTSALFLGGVITREPIRHTVTIPSNVCMPGAWRDTCACFYVKPEMHSAGLIRVRTPLGNMVSAYDPERAVCDLMRSRNRFDVDTVVDAMKAYAAWPRKDLRRLAGYARMFRVRGELQRYMDILL